MIIRQLFFDAIRPLFGGKLNQRQVDTINTILNECEAQGVTDLRQVAYVLATPYWECYNPKTPETRLTPIREFGGEKYLKSKKYWPHYGRGLSQLTWPENYRKEGKRLGIDLLNQPDLILGIGIAANSHVFCMRTGTYTGKKLSDYINGTKCDYLNARRIINGTDRAQQFATTARLFEKALTSAQEQPNI